MPAPGWVKRDVSGAVPAARQGHAVAVVGKKAFVFGGSSGSGYGEHYNGSSEPVYLNDLFVLKVGLQVTWERIRQLGDVPKGRDGHTMSAVGSVLYLFGGSNFPESDECLEGLYAYDIGTLSWELCPTQGRQPRALGHTTAAVGDSLYIFGGIYKGEAKNTLYMLNTGNLTWTPLKTSGMAPAPRCDQACTVSGERFYIMGGTAGEQLWFNDLHMFDTVTLTWQCVSEQGSQIYPRSLHTICAHHDKDIYLFGGANDTAKEKSPFGDLWKFSLSKLKWKRLQCDPPSPDRRLGHASMIIYGQLIIFGGMNDETDFNDVCIWQTRAAARHLPQEMAGLSSPSSADSRSVTGPDRSYDSLIPIPAPYKPVLPVLAEPAKPPDFDDIKASFVKKTEDIFEDLAAKYAELETQKQALKTAVEAFHEEKTTHAEQYEQQQKELEEMFLRHKSDNEEWIRTRREEIEQERKTLQEDREKLNEEWARLREEKENLRA